MGDTMNITKPLQVKEKGNNLKGQYWTFVIYPNEDIEHKKVFDILTKEYSNHCRWILHDKDKWCLTQNDEGKFIHLDGEPKKEHYHFLFKSHNTISIDVVSSLIHLPTHYIEKVNSVAVAVEYLLHRDLGSLFDDYKFKYPTYALQGCLEINPNKWDESYLFEHWSLYIKNTNQLWGDVVFTICNSGHFKWLNKYRRLLKDIYDSSHFRESTIYENENQERSKKHEYNSL